MKFPEIFLNSTDVNFIRRYSTQGIKLINRSKLTPVKCYTVILYTWRKVNIGDQCPDIADRRLNKN